MKHIGIGVIGTGHIATEGIIPAYSHDPRAVLTRVCDINAGRAEAVAHRFGFTRSSDCIDDMARDNDIQAVSVCTWNADHASCAIRMLEAGKSVLLEKPMALCSAEAERICEAARKSSGQFMMGMCARYYENVIYLNEMREAGEFGEIYAASVKILRRRGTPIGWFTDKNKSGGGPVIDLGVHAIDQTWYLMGRPRAVSVSATVHYDKISEHQARGIERWQAVDPCQTFNVEDSANGIIRFENGASMQFEISWALNGEETDNTAYTTLYGTRAGATTVPLKIYTQQHGYLIDIAPRLINPADFGKDRFIREVRHFLDCVENEVEPDSPAQDGLAIQKILDAIYESGKLGREVHIS